MKLSGAQWTSVVLSAAALSSVALVLLTRETATTTERTERARNLLPVFREEDVERLELTSGGKSFRVERRRTGDAGEPMDDWILLLPEPEPADGAAVDRLVAGLGFATPVRRLDTGDRAALGLDTPEASITLDMGGTELELLLGREAPAPAGGRYVAVDGRGVERQLAVVTREVASLFLTTANDLRERRLVAFGAREIREILLERSGTTLRLVRSGTGFRIDGKERANRDLLDPFFSALARLEAKRFLSVTEAEKARSAPPTLVLGVRPKDESDQPVTIELGGGCPDEAERVIAVVRAPRPSAACVEPAVVAMLELERERLFDDKPFGARPDEVESVTIERGERRLVLARQGSAFLLREPSQAAVELEAGNRRLEAIVASPAELVAGADPKRLGLDPPAGRAVLTVLGDDDNAVEETLLLGNTEPDGTLYVRRADDGAVLALGREAARAFAVDSTLLKSQRVLDFALSALAELALTEPERQVLRRAPGTGFELAEPKGFEHDGALATDAALALGSLTALRWVADSDDGSFGFATPALTAHARFDADGGTQTVLLSVGRRTPGGYFAKVDRDPGVFVVERSVAERLGTLLIARSAFVADSKTLARVTLRSKGVSHALERKQDGLVPAPGSGIDPAVAARVVEALESLRAEAAVHTGPARPNEGLASPELEVRYETLPGLGASRSFRIGSSAAPSELWTDGARLSAHYARADGIDATFIVADSKLKPLFDLF